MASSFSMLSPSGRTLIVTFLLVSIIYLTTTALNAANRPISGSFRGSSSGIPASQERTKAIDLRIVGLIFYGRREFVSILHCYLERNLKKNGGLLDEVIFVVRTEKKEDLDWLDDLLQTTPEYTSYTLAKGRNGEYADSWDVVQNGTWYIKIDDDTVFFEDHTIEAMVRRKMEHPEFFLISANTINQPAQSWVHYHLGTDHPYLPELEPAPGFVPRTQSNIAGYHDQEKPTWRASELPQWSGPADYTIDENSAAPFVGHRWLPLPAGSDIDQTPISVVEYNLAGPGWHSWVVGAQTHYSFFENLEKDQLHRYKYDLWDYHYDRISINFILITGEDVLRVMPLEDDDEGYLTTKATKALGRHAVMEGAGLAIHFSFGAQVMAHDRHGIRDTDALDRYRAFADERVCGQRRGSKLVG